MRKSLKLLAAAVLLLPGCIIVPASEWDDEDGPFHHGSLQRRVATLEAHMAACQSACPAPCCAGESAEKK